MYSPESEDVYRAARAYLPNLPESMQKALGELLDLAEAGQKMDNRIIDLMAEDDRARKWMRAALFTETTRTLSKEYDQLGGIKTPFRHVTWSARNVDSNGIFFASVSPSRLVQMI